MVKKDEKIFGTKKCNDIKKEERFLKKYDIKYQFIEYERKGFAMINFIIAKKSVVYQIEKRCLFFERRKIMHEISGNFIVDYFNQKFKK